MNLFFEDESDLVLAVVSSHNESRVLDGLVFCSKLN